MPRNKYSIDLQKHMAVCDANYIRLLKLLPQLEVYRSKILKISPKKCEDFDTTYSYFELNKVDIQELLNGLKKEFCIADALTTGEAVTVELTVLETFKYTNTLKIIQKPELTEWIKKPVMLVRIYHDASTAEVISSQGQNNFQARYPRVNPMMYHSDEKKQINVFLGEWLSLCLNVGRSAELPALTVKI
tara:strand:- start:939 stop:1505 length:567 start_codon:yes stop_codon:yes gene_type:complete